MDDLIKWARSEEMRYHYLAEMAEDDNNDTLAVLHRRTADKFDEVAQTLFESKEQHQCLSVETLIYKIDGGRGAFLCSMCYRVVGYLPEGWESTKKIVVERDKLAQWAADRYGDPDEMPEDYDDFAGSLMDSGVLEDKTEVVVEALEKAAHSGYFGTAAQSTLLGMADNVRTFGWLYR